MAERTVSKAQSGSTLRASVGDSIVVRLPENPTTGFRWTVDTYGEHVLALAGDDFLTAREGGMGAGGERIFRFVARSAGTIGLQLKLWRGWEGEASVSDRFTLTVEVA